MMQRATFNQVFNKLAYFTATATILSIQVANAQASGLIPCDGDDCTINSVMALLNNLMNFFFTKLLFPIFIVMIMYLGYTYFAAQGKPGQHAKLGSMAKHIVLGLLLMLCAWVIVKIILSILGYSDTFGFFTS